MATRRSSSWYAFLREGSTSSLPPGTEIPSSMLSQFPEEVRDSRIVKMSEMKYGICPRILLSKNCDRGTNCPCFHPDFIADTWVAPDLLCHKWFQGVCSFGTRCCNQHGDTFDDAMRRSVHTESTSSRWSAVLLRSR